MGNQKMNNEQSVNMEEFNNLCVKIRSCENSYGEEIESLYEELLDLLKTNVHLQQEYTKALKSAVLQFRNARREGPGILSIDAIAYCMHELRWDDVLQAALEEQRSYFIPRQESTLVRLIEAFEDDWLEAESYERYSRRT